MLRRLTPPQRRVLYMRIEECKSFRQIARELGFKSVATVFQHYRYALAKARAQIARQRQLMPPPAPLKPRTDGPPVTK